MTQTGIPEEALLDIKIVNPVGLNHNGLYSTVDVVQTFSHGITKVLHVNSQKFYKLTGILNMFSWYMLKNEEMFS